MKSRYRFAWLVAILVPGFLAGVATPALSNGTTGTFFFDPIDAGTAGDWALSGRTGTVTFVTDDDRTVLRLAGGTEAEPARLVSPSLGARGNVEIVLALQTEVVEPAGSYDPHPTVRFLDAEGSEIGTFGTDFTRAFFKTPTGWNLLGGIRVHEFYTEVLRFTLDGTELKVAPNYQSSSPYAVDVVSTKPVDRIELVSAGRWVELDLVTVMTPGQAMHDSFGLQATANGWPDGWRLAANENSLKRSPTLGGAHDTVGRLVSVPTSTGVGYAATAVGWSPHVPTTVYMSVRPDAEHPMNPTILSGLNAAREPTWTLSFITGDVESLGSMAGLATPSEGTFLMTTGPGAITVVGEDATLSDEAWATVRLDTDPAASAIQVTINGGAPVTVHVPGLAATAEIAIGDVATLGNTWGAGEGPGRTIMDELVIIPRT